MTSYSTFEPHRIFLQVLAALALMAGVGDFFSTSSASVLLDNLQPGHWVEVPNSRLDAVAPVPLPPGNTTANGSPFGIVSAESGAAFDTKRNRFMVWGGGHGDYSGNEIYAFDVDTLAWDRIEDPTPNNLINDFSGGPGETYSDGKPVSRHSYDSLVYLPEQDALWTQGGSRWMSGEATWATWQYDLTLGTWEQKTDASTGFPSTYGVNAQYDPVTEKIIWRNSVDTNPKRVQEYDPVTEVWTLRNASPSTGSTSSTSALDPGRRTVVYVGVADYAPFGTSPNQLYTYNIDTHQYLNLSMVATGDTEIHAGRAPGLAYSPVADTIVAWKGADVFSAASDIYTFDIDTNVWTKIAADPANTVTPTQPANTGTFGRWQYIPSEDVFMLYNDVAQNVFFYRLASAGPDGDFDGDNDVDGDDFLAWQRNPGVGDLADWQSDYGLFSATAASTSVPEPGSLALLLTGLLGITKSRFLFLKRNQ